ncbi:hypothetical protein RUM44_001893 [Polyplax serrata]|uniref:beta-N-acetylhexosaminidase n=1 Tax=Polyplax serrata TaxID=468196 RepID=A0ABR1ALE8_POLSC
MGRGSALRKKTVIDEKNSFIGERIVHLDLKGAPPSIEYIDSFMNFIASMGATGILIEYEDMFPYSNELEGIKAHNAYTPQDIKKILFFADLNNLTVVPLVQTFGHLEFVLKLEKYKNHREVSKYPQVLCPTYKDSTWLINRMIDQVLKAHPTSKYIHIGCDEVFYLGKCERCKKKMADEKLNEHKLFLNHVKKVASYVTEVYKVRPIIWGDKITDLGVDLIKEFQIPQLLDVMLWHYRPDVSMRYDDKFFEVFGRVFNSFWIAGAFKGATAVDSIVTNRKYHLANLISWMEIIITWNHKINFKGIVLTGWQRYDHFSVLCELLPVGIPSLATSLEFLNTISDVDDETLGRTLECQEVDTFDTSVSIFHPQAFCNFPGFYVYKTIVTFYNLQQRIYSLRDIPNGWFSTFNILYSFSSPAQVENFVINFPIDALKLELKESWSVLQEHMNEIYDEYTVNEWLLTYIVPFSIRLDGLSKAKKAILMKRDWPRRPFVNKTAIQSLQTACSTDNEFCGSMFFT